MAFWPWSKASGGSARRARWSPRATCLILGAGAALAVWVLAALGATERLELKGLDLLFQIRGPRPAASPVVIVAIDYESLQALGKELPWPREVHARLIERLKGARVVALDVVFERPGDPQQDRRLVAAARGAGNVVWAASFSTAREARFILQRLVPPLPLLLGASPHFGYVNVLLDPDNTVRRAAPVKVDRNDVTRSFALKIVEQYTGESPLAMTSEGMQLLLRGRRVSLDADNAFLINYVGPPQSFPYLSYQRVLKGEVPAEAFRDKIVLIGLTSSTAVGTQDHFYTPFYWRVQGANELMPGVEVHANIIDTFLGARPLGRASSLIRVVVLLAMGLAIGLLMGSLRPVWGALGSVGAGLAYIAIPVALFNARQVWLDLATPLLLVPVAVGATALYRFTGEERMRGVASRTLGRYVSREVAQEILDRGEDIALGGTRRRISVLFTDIRGFTTLSERLRPEEVVALLNRFFTSLSVPILRQKGTLDKYIGDAVMAFWGAPLLREDDAARAVRAGLEMLREAEALSRELEGLYGARLEIGIGISTGDAVVGHIGSPERMGYTAIGDTVNIASRLQDLTKEHGAPLLISHSTYDEVKHDFQTERVGFVPVKGRTEPIGVYRVLREKPAPVAGVETRL